MKLLYLEFQGKELPIKTDKAGRPEIPYTRIYSALRRFEVQSCFDAMFAGSVSPLHQKGQIELRVIHGDGTTAAKKGGNNLGYSGQESLKGDQVVAFYAQLRCACSVRNCNGIAPIIAAPGNWHESPLLQTALPQGTRIAQQVGLDLNQTIVSLDAADDSPANRKAIFNWDRIPNIPANPYGRKTPQRGHNPIFDPALYQERFYTLERVLTWEDKVRRLLLRFGQISSLHYALKSLAYPRINLRHFCQS